MGEHTLFDAPIVPLAASQHDHMLEEAETIWLSRKDDFDPGPVGYLVYDCASGKIVIENRVDTPAPEIQTTAPEQPVRRPAPRRPLWRRLWSGAIHD